MSREGLMAPFLGKSAAATVLLVGVAFLLFTHLAAGQQGNDASKSRTSVLTRTSLSYIDAHTHIYQLDPEGAVTLILSAMERLNGAKAFIQTEPYGPDNPTRWDAEMILPAVKKHPEKLAGLSGPYGSVWIKAFAPFSRSIALKIS